MKQFFIVIQAIDQEGDWEAPFYVGFTLIARHQTEALELLYQLEEWKQLQQPTIEKIKKTWFSWKALRAKQPRLDSVTGRAYFAASKEL